MNLYFNLYFPDSERLIGDGSRSNLRREDFPCPITTEHLDGRRRAGPVVLQMDHNRRDEQLIWWLGGFVIHQQVLEEFVQHGFTGFRTRPATVRFRDGFESDDYREFIVTGWTGVASPESGIRVVKSCPACHWKRYSPPTNIERLIDWSQWTGEDFFMVWPLPKFILITERVAMWLLSSGVKSFTLRGFSDQDRAFGRSGFGVARLSEFLPEDLAIKYGRPLGLE